MPRHRKPHTDAPAIERAAYQQPVRTMTAPPELGGAGGLPVELRKWTADDAAAVAGTGTLGQAMNETFRDLESKGMLPDPPPAPIARYSTAYAESAADTEASRPDIQYPPADEATDEQRERADTLHRFDVIEDALELHAKAIGELQRALKARTQAAPEPQVKRATGNEEADYSLANFALNTVGRTPFDGIDAWRKAGSPDVHHLSLTASEMQRVDHLLNPNAPRPRLMEGMA